MGCFTDTSKLSLDQKLAWDEIVLGKNLFITARAGAGKSYLINFIRKNFPGNVIVTASTGIAANSIGGRTIHSQFLINPYNPDPEQAATNLSSSRRKYALQSAHLLIIDEISMVSDRLLDCLNKTCKIFKKSDRPFGGMQIVVFGDFLQLPPVFKGDTINDKICWDCESWREAKIETFLITSNFRQSTDEAFYNLLTRLRYNQLTEEDINLIKSRQLPADDSAIRIFSTNNEVDKYNYAKYIKLDPKTEHKYIARSSGDKSLIESYWKDALIPQELELRTGARVMMCKNLNMGGDSYLFNGSLGWVIGFVENNDSDDLDTGCPIIAFDCGITCIVNQEIIYQPKEQGYSGEEIPLATIEQIPLKLAYAVTVHKSQGQTFDKVFMDCSRTFLFGQVYVALSRARTLDGLIIYGFNAFSKGSISDPIIVSKYLQLEQEAQERRIKKYGV